MERREKSGIKNKCEIKIFESKQKHPVLFYDKGESYKKKSQVNNILNKLKRSNKENCCLCNLTLKKIE